MDSVSPNGRQAEARDLYFSEGGFLFDPATGLTYTLNHTGAFIFHRLRGKVPRDQILTELVSRFQVEPDQARSDLEDFLWQIREFGLEDRSQAPGEA